MKRVLLLIAAALILALPTTASAQYTRSWVSGTGSDSNTCQRHAPCATWAAAISNTIAGGEVDALDSGAFGPVTIDKSITLDGGGVLAGMITSGGSAITINNPAAKVVLRGLNIYGASEGIPPGASFGVDIQAARAVRIEGLRIADFSGPGIRSAPTNSPARLTVLDTIIADNGSNGISVNAGTGGASGTVNRVTLRRVELIDNDLNGLATNAPGSNRVSVSVFDSLVADNTTNGIVSTGPNSRVRISDVDVTGNGQGLRSMSGGALLSWGNNHVADNVIDGAPTAIIGPK